MSLNRFCCNCKSLILFAAVVLCAGILFNFSSLPALGQASTGTLTGQVTDQQGALVAGANVKMIDPSTNSTRETLTNDAGRYTIPNVQPGTYTVTVTKEGFSAAKFSGQVVDVGQVLTLDVPLAVGSTSTTVEVTAAAAAELQTLNATVGSTIRNESLNLLPNLARDASYLAVLQVGVSLDGNVAGAQTDQNKFQLDGGNNSDDMAGGNATYTPGNGYAGTAGTGGTPTGVMPTPVESIEEFKVGTIGQSADFGAAGGSQVQMVTKRGTNAYHGAIYEYYFSTDVGAANTWKANHVPDAQTNTLFTPLPSAHRNHYGGAFGGPIFPKEFLGGKWYFFSNYEAVAFPNNVTFERATPTATYRAGVITMPNTAGVLTPYNINANPVTVNGVTYAGCQTTGSCDPRGLGVNPLIQKLWATMPLPNDPTYISGTPGDAYGPGANSGGYLAPLTIPQTSKFIVGRIDHDFNEKNKFFASYRYYDFNQLVSVQTDMGGLLPGATQGQYTAYGIRPQKPGYWVAGLTTTINTNMTNDFRFSYLRNYWNWQTQAGPPQFAGLGGVLEPGGESANALLPYNVDSQDARQRYWRGHDYFLNDQVSHLKGNHLIQYGFTYQRNHDIHGRNDNGVGIDTSPAYIVGSTTLGNAISPSSYTLPTGAPTSDLSNWQVLFDQAAGILTQTQVMYTRSGQALTLNPLGTPGFDDSIIPSYEAFVTDTWHVKPHLTLTYGITYELAMPPYEVNGKQVEMVDAAGNPIDIKGYLNNKATAALAGQVYQPQIGFDLIGNASGGQLKYPFHPFYGGFSPHVSLAWNPNFNDGILSKIFGRNNTVIRGGYGRIYGRLNGVDLMLVPLLGPGLLQATACVGPTVQGTCANSGGATLLTAFRIGTDGLVAPLPGVGLNAGQVTQTLPQPFVPGSIQNGLLNAAAADGSQLDPNLRPNHSDEVTFTIQRSLSPKLLLEAGYIGRKISNEFQEINIDAVPTMMTMGGQSFAQAYAAVYTEYCGLQGATVSGTCNKTPGAVTNQPFFEAALGGPTSAYCAAAGSCTKAVVAAEGSNFATTNVYALWTDIGKSSSWVPGRTLLTQSQGAGLNAQLAGSFEFINSYGHGTYNALFFTFKTTNWHGWTTQQNFTWGRALGTGSVTQASSSITVPNPFDFNNFGSYGVQPFDVKFTYNFVAVYQEPFFRSQKGIVGHLLGGWTVAPLFTARSGLPQRINCASSNTCSGADADISENYSEAAGTGPFTGGYAGEGYYNFQNGVATGPGSSGNPAKGGSGINLFNNPVQVASEFRPYVLGLDQNSGGAGVIRGFPYWNLDATISKDFRATEHIGATLIIQAVNVLNHFVPSNPTTNIQSTASFGVVTNQYTSGNGVAARWMEFGLRLRF